jgi:hypothetical protein
VLHGAGEIDVAGPGPLDLLEPLEFGVLVDHFERQRAPERHALPQAGEEGDGVGLDPLPTPAAVASLAPPQFGVDDRGVDGQAGGKPVHEGHEGGPVRFTGGPVAEHGGTSRGEGGAKNWLRF